MPIVGIERAFNDPAVGLRCIDHCPLAAAYCNVTVINDYISAFDVVDIVVALNLYTVEKQSRNFLAFFYFVPVHLSKLYRYYLKQYIPLNHRS